MLETIGKILVIAPHTDDGEMGCGGTIARFVEAAKEIHYLALSSCADSVPEGLPRHVLVSEVKAATKVLGIAPERLRVEGYQVRTLNHHRQEILELLVAINRELEPDLVFIPSLTDLHQDHQTAAQEALRAFKRTSILSYEMPWNNLSFETQCFVPLSETHVQKKIAAVGCYHSQQSRSYTAPEYVLALLRMRGQQVEVQYAECFEVVRWILS